MRSKFLKASVWLMFLVAALWAVSFAAPDRPDKDKSGKNSTATLAKVTGDPRWEILNVNNITTWARSDGDGNHSPTGDNGVYYPIGTGNVVYEDNLVFGGLMFLDGAHTQPAALQKIRIGGGSYLSNHGLVAGWVDGTSPATAVGHDPNDPLVRAYRVRRDYTIMSASELAKDAQTYYELSSVNDVTQTQMDNVIAQYAKDWDEWPTDRGAPYVERNGIPGYQKPPPFSATFTVDSLISGNYDEPGVTGSDPTTPADQVMFMAYNGLNRNAQILFEGSEPIGMEIQKTVWAYKRTDALGNIYFTRYRLINKGGVDIGGGTKGAFYIDSMYVCQWSDIDLGNAGDDLVGCDSTLSMGFVYNGAAVDNTFKNFGLPPPCSGYDFLAGPTVTQLGDSAVKGLQRIYDKHNLGMSSFAFFSAGSPFSDPPFNNYDLGTGRWWALIRGYAPLGTISDAPTPYPFPPGQPRDNFPYSGDPYTQTGFLDGLGTSYSFPPGDRRILLNTGPFTMNPGDTQEVYMAFVVGIGGDRLSSVAVMKSYDKAAQETFDLLFKVAKPPSNPDVKFSELDGKVILEWASDAARVADTEGKVVDPGQYAFQGYSLYQFPSSGASLASAKRIATWDIVDNVKVITDNRFDPITGQFVNVPVQFGSDSGVKRFFTFARDYLRDVDKIYNGQEYYLAVTSYSYTTLAGYTSALESSPNILTVRPKIPFGKTLVASAGDTVAITKTAGGSDGSGVALVVDPSKITGDTYEIRFDTTGGTSTWHVQDVTKNTTVISKLTNQLGDDNYPIVDGMIVKAVGPPNDAKDFQHVANPSGAINPPTYVGFSTFNSWGFPDPDPSRGGAPVTDFGGGRWGIHTGGSGGGDESYAGRFKPRVFRNDDFTRFVPYDFEIRFTAAGGKAYMAFTTGAIIDVPFELWNIGINTPNNPSDDFRMIPWINDGDGDGTFNLEKIDHGLSGGDNDPYTDWIYWHDPNPKTAGSAGYNAFVADSANYDAGGAVTGTGGEVMARVVLVNVNGGSVSDVTWPANVNSLMPATGNVFRIISTKPNTPADVYSFNTAAFAPVANATLAKASAEHVGVFPNPYYAFNTAEVSRFNRFVTFNNLPPKAKIRIFNLAGQLVRTIDKNDPTQFARWDLANERNYPVASGMYVAHVDMPDIGVTRILKLAIIQEQEVLDIF